MTRYELLDRIGVGGMAEIFRGKAVAAGGFEKPVAIKRILPHLSQDTRFVELLIAEAKVLSLLKHRNIVQIFDVGLGDDGQYFLVMEYVDGKDLGAVQRGLEARRHRMPFDLALHVGAEICEALEHAHTARAPDGKPMLLVHRDVSPSNVLLSRAGECKLTDFGIAKRAEAEQTGHGAVRGKFAYISPEQARNEHIDPRSDVFSVGILLWELLTNRRLFSGLGDLEALRAVRDAQVPRPSEADPRLDKQVDGLLMAALARRLQDRPTAGQLGAQLRSLRYSLETTVGDPATELAKIIDTADEVERQSQQIAAPVLRPSGRFGAFADAEHTEATVIRIRTADEFSMRDKDGTGMARIRQVIDHFEEEQTRQATLSGDQLRFLRQAARHDSGEMQAIPPPRPGKGVVSQGGLPGVRSRPPTDEPTRAQSPLFSDDAPTVAQLGSPADLLGDEPPNSHLPSDEHTRLVARSRDAISRRTPAGGERARPATVPPPVPSRSAATAPPPLARPPVAAPSPLPRPPAIATPYPHPGMQPPGIATPYPNPNMPIHPGMNSGVMNPSALPPMQPNALPPYRDPNGSQPMPPMHGSPYPQWDPSRPSANALPMFPPQHAPQVAGFQQAKKPGLKPWMLVVGAILMAVIAFAVTRAFLS